MHVTAQGTQWIKVSQPIWKLFGVIASRHASVSKRLRALADQNVYSRQAIQKYIQANNKVGNLSETAFRNHVNRAITSGKDKGDFAQPKGKSPLHALWSGDTHPSTYLHTRFVVML